MALDSPADPPLPAPAALSRPVAGGPVARLREALSAGTGDLFARSLVLNTGGRVVSLGLGFVTSVLLARMLGPSARGLLGLMLSVSTIALAVTAVGQPLAVTYYASRKDSDGRSLLGNTLVHAALLAAVLIPLTALAHRPLADLLGHHRGGTTWILAGVLVPITLLDWTTSNGLLGLLRFGLYNGIKFACAIAYAVAVIVLVGVLHLGVAGALLATGLGSALTIAACAPPMLRGGAPRVDRGLMRGMLRYGSRVQVGVIFGLVNYRLDVVIMQFYRPLRQVGYYIVAQTIAELVLTLTTAFQSSLLPLVSHHEGDARRDEITRSSIRHHGLLALVALGLNAGAGSAVIVLAYGHAFSPAVLPMLMLLPGIWFLGLGLVIQSDLGGRGRPGLSSALAGGAAAVTAILDVVLIPPFGVPGAALASVIAYTAFGISSLIALHRVSGIAVRELVVPTRADLAVYIKICRRATRKRAR
jgi:O-antigen/teichoic acid export membrane protein